MVFGCIYRPPDSPVNFWNELEDEVDDISSFMDMLPLLHVLVYFNVKGEVKAKIKISPVVVFGVLSRMVLVRES